MRIRLLGPVAAGPADGVPEEAPGRVPAAVLAHLALAQGHVLTPEALAERVWDDPPDNVRNALQAAVSRVRRAYGDDLVRTSHAGYTIGTDGVEVDAHRASALLARAADGDLAAGAEALALWQGEPLAGLTSTASDLARRSLQELHRRLVAAYAETLLRRRRPADAVPLLQEEAAQAPYDEPLHALLMRALAAAGRAGDALDAFDALRRRLADDLGIDPSSEVASTFAAVLSGSESDVVDPVVSETQVRTVLLTDIVGSARLWQERPDSVPRALLAHHALVSDVVARYGGTLPPDQGEGDARLAVFASSTDALACAQELQRELAGLEWPDGLRLHVRAALARGPLVESDGNVFGAAVPRCARLRALAHGDQVLLTAEVAEDAPGATTRPLGRVPLRDFGDTEVLQLDDPEAPREFPPLRTAVRLPARTSALLGRDDDLGELQRLVGGHRVVTVTGLGGSGKTALAVQVARSLTVEFPDGVIFCDLSSCLTAQEVLDRIGSAILGDGSSSALDALRATGSRTLLVLDNLEQVVDASEAVATVVGESAVHVLATSRTPVGVPGEIVRPLGPLAERDAVALLAARAAEHAPGRTFDAPALVAVARAVGGVPLALELAAGRLRVVHAATLADSLRDRLSLLSATRGVPERQRAVEALLADTWVSLPATSQQVLAALSVSRQPLTASSLSDLTALATLDVADALDDLGSRGLARAGTDVGSAPAFTVLELVRSHAVEASPPEVVQRLRHAHARLVAAAVSRGAAPPRDDVVEALRTVRGRPSEHDAGERIVLARAAVGLGLWDDAIAVLEGCEGTEADNLTGVALVRSADPGDVVRGREHLRRAADAGDADAAATLGGSLRTGDPQASYSWYLRALELDPTDPYALGNVVEHELIATGDDSPLRLRRDALLAARDRRRVQRDEGRDLPWSAYDLARTGIWLGDDDALHDLLDGVAASTGPRQIETTLASFRRLQRDDDAWSLGTAVLEVALRRAATAPTSVADVLVVAGASAASSHDSVMSWRSTLVEAVQGTVVEIVSGGTDRGVSELAALVAKDAGVRSVGWLPMALPTDVPASTEYVELRRTDGQGFSLREPLAYWDDLLARGIDPARVHVLGLGGGALTALELHLAQALGASVAVGAVEGSAVRLGLRRTPVALPRDPEVVRSWVRS